MTCLPCAKEIINSFARTAWDISHEMSAKMPTLVAEGRLSTEDADLIYGMLISAEKDYVAAVQGAGEHLSNLARPPWPEKTEV